MKPIKVDEILNKSVYLDKGIFKVEIGEREFKSESLERLKLDVRDSHILEIDEEVYYDSSGDLIPTKIVRITSERVILSRYRAGIGVNPDLYIEEARKDIFPLTEKNKEIFKKNQDLRKQGWALIEKAEELIKDMDTFPKDYFSKKLKILALPSMQPIVRNLRIKI